MTRINVFDADNRVVTDFGEGPKLEGESAVEAGIRIYRDWCLGTPGGVVEPDPNPLVIVHG